MDVMCKCNHLVHLEDETGTPYNFHHGKYEICKRSVTIKIHVKTGERIEYWTEPENEVENSD